MRLITLTSYDSDGKVLVNPDHIISIERLLHPNQEVVGSNIRFSGNQVVGQFKETQDEVAELVLNW